MRIEFMFKDAEIICNHPAWMLLDDTLYYFDKDIEGKKLQPFLNKRFIPIPLFRAIVLRKICCPVDRKA
jgi:hypothetical protein